MSTATLAPPAWSPHSLARRAMAGRLERAGIAVGGGNPWDLQVHDERVWLRILRDHSLGLGEAYMDGWWDCEAIDQLLARVFRSGVHTEVGPLTRLLRPLRATLVNLQSQRRASQVCEEHYDLGNDLFRAMLDPELVYTCAFWQDAQTLAEAQAAKLDLVCRKLGLQPGMTLLDIGCGYGSLMRHAARHYGVTCVGYSLSVQQTELGRELSAGLPITFHLEDYRNIRGQYDRVASIGMFEAVGAKNHAAFMDVLARVLPPDGAALLHTMGANVSGTAYRSFADRYIFPNGMMPSLSQLGVAAEGRLIVEDLHNLGPDYDRALMAWHANFQAAWPTLAERYGPRFKRMWEFYLLAFAAGFRARQWQLWQLVLAPPGAPQRDYRV